MKDTLSALGIDERRILKELRAIAFSRITDVMQGDAYTLKDLSELSDDTKAALKKIKRQEGKTFKIEVEMYDKIKALGKLAQYIGMDDAAESGGNLNIVVNTGIERAPDSPMVTVESVPLEEEEWMK